MGSHAIIQDGSSKGLKNWFWHHPILGIGLLFSFGIATAIMVGLATRPTEIERQAAEKMREERIQLLRPAERSDFVRFEGGELCLVEMSRPNDDLRCNLPPGTSTGETRIHVQLVPVTSLPVELIPQGTPRYKIAAEAYVLRRKLGPAP